jgi:hypothetical protein
MQMREVMERNESYYLGEQMDRTKFFSYELPTAENLLYMATENKISIITSKRREPTVLAAQNNDESRDLAQKTQQFLTAKWSELDMDIRYENWARHAELYPIAVLKVRWDIDTDDMVFENIRPNRVIIDKDAKNEDDAKFIAELREDSAEDIIRMFVNENNEVDKTVKTKITEAVDGKMATRIKYIEYWTNEFVVWKYEKTIIKKKKNPYWNWNESTEDRKENYKKLKGQWTEKIKNEKLENLLLNFFDKPRKPYVIVSLKNLGKTIYGDTSDFEQGIVIQDIINKRKRQIDKAAEFGRGRLVGSGSFIEEEEFKKAIASPNASIWLPQGNPSDAINFLQPQPVSPVLFDDLRESKQALDNIVGIHGTTRGERGPQETATGRQILREGDLGRIDLAVRRIDKKLELVYGWMMQMVKVFYTEMHFIKYLGSEDSARYLEFSTNDIEDGQKVMVKSELTVDKSTQRQAILQRAQLGLLDPHTMFEKFDDPNPKETALKLVLFQQDPKLYIQKYLVDENTEGAENDPIIKAKKENKDLLNGEKVPPFNGATPEHLQEHQKFAEKPEFKKADEVVMTNFMNHVQAEIEIVRQNAQLTPEGAPASLPPNAPQAAPQIKPNV